MNEPIRERSRQPFIIMQPKPTLVKRTYWFAEATKPGFSYRETSLAMEKDTQENLPRSQRIKNLYRDICHLKVIAVV